jgi:carbon monoxide dehydrogenase subunit G
LHIQNSFVVPAQLEDAWAVLLDVETLAPCMPGASVESFDGEQIVGSLRVKLGPITVSYGGTAHFLEKDAESQHVVLRASGRERNGSGTANADITADLVDEGHQTRVNVVTEIDITGRPAQFGRGVITSVARQIVDKFAANLAAKMTASHAPVPELAIEDHSPGDASETASRQPPWSAPADTTTSEPPNAQAASALDVMELLGLRKLGWAKYAIYAVIAVLLSQRVVKYCRQPSSRVHKA